MTANLSNCQKLYELSGWAGTEKYMSPRGTLTRKENASDSYIPAYSLDYLLDKLPYKIVDVSEYFILTLDKGAVWNCCYNFGGKTKYMQQADTHVDAACLLAIKLIEEGIIDVKA